MGGIMVLLLLIITLHVNLGHGDANMTMRCTDKEREALLAFKQGLIMDKHSQAILSSWGSEAAKQDCCRWEGVSCDNQIGHVVRLDLSYHAVHLDLGGDYYLQGTMISPKLIELKHLKYLGLSGVNFSGSQLPYFIGSLTNLGHLDLSRCVFGGKFPIQVGNLTNLQYLDLSFIDFRNVENLNWLPRLSSLTYLDLSHNNLSNVFYWSEAVNKLPKLTTLTLWNSSLPSPPVRSTLSNIYSSKSLSTIDLSLNRLSTSSIFLWMSNYSTSLVDLDLSSNHLTGSIPDVFGNMSSLAHVYLTDNQLEGAEPHSFSRLCSLQSLDLSGNNLSGQFSRFVPTCAQNSLESLWLGQNQLAGPLPDLTNFLSLKELSISYNQLSGRIPESIGQMSKLEYLDLGMYFQLDHISLGSCKMGPYFPKWLQTQNKYLFLNISNAGIVDILPSWFWGTTRYVTSIDLSHNQIGEMFTNLTVDFANYPKVHLRSNQIEGQIPATLSHASYLDLSNNNISGSISFLCASGAMRLSFLNLSYNNLSRELPECLTRLGNLVMLTGQITPDIGKLESLDSLDLSRNHIDGRIPTSLARISRLSVLDLSHNNLIGKIPTGTQLQSFDPSVYAGNPQLCGPPLKKPCDIEETGPDQVSNEEDKDGQLIRYGFYISMGLGFYVGFWGVCGSLIFIREWRYTYFKFLNSLNDWLYVRVVLIKRKLTDA
ncbi:unnamed protein product [Malus baccata var. baccata]